MLIDMLGNLTVAMHGINEDLCPDKSLKITIKHLQPGCYDIFLMVKETFLNPLIQCMDKTDITAAWGVIGGLASLITIRKWLKGEKPQEIRQEGTETILINGDGNELRIEKKIYNIYKENRVVDSAIGKSFEAIEEDEKIEGFEIYDKDKNNLCEIPREDFQWISKPPAVSREGTRTKTDEATLTIFKVVFEKGYKWQFYYKGHKISATVKDEDFFSAIDHGERFAKGDKLVAEIEITQVFDKSVQAYINKEFVVTKIKHRILRDEQMDMFEDE